MATELDDDAIVLDLMLFELWRRLRQADRWTPVPPLTPVTGWSTTWTAWMPGANDHLVKPFTFARLTTRLRTLIWWDRAGAGCRGGVLAAGRCRAPSGRAAVPRGGRHLRAGSAASVEVSSTSDELAALAAAMNRLLARLQAVFARERQLLTVVDADRLRQAVDKPATDRGQRRWPGLSEDLLPHAFERFRRRPGASQQTDTTSASTPQDGPLPRPSATARAPVPAALPAQPANAGQSAKPIPTWMDPGEAKV